MTSTPLLQPHFSLTLSPSLHHRKQQPASQLLRDDDTSSSITVGTDKIYPT